MSWYLHWGERINWVPVVCLGVTAVLLFLTRFLTVWFWWRRLRKAQCAPGDEMDESEFEKITLECINPKTHPVPIFVSFLYGIFYLVFAAMLVWGTVSTAWWVLLVGVLAAVLIHIPFRESMAGLNQIERLRKLGAFAANPGQDE